MSNKSIRMSISSNISKKNPIDLTRHPRLHWTTEAKVERMVLGIGSMYRANMRMIDWALRYFSPRLGWEQKCPTKLILGAASTAKRHESHELIHGILGARRRLRFWDEDQVERNLGRVGHVCHTAQKMYEHIIRTFSLDVNQQRGQETMEKNSYDQSIRDYMKRLDWHSESKAWLWNLRVKTIYFQNQKMIESCISQSNDMIANALKEQEKILAETARPYQTLSEPFMRESVQFKEPWNLN
jgi:hypothetical protein